MAVRKLVALVIVLFITNLTSGLVHAMTSVNYSIDWDSINSGGEDTSSSTNYSLRDTVGEQATGFSSSTNYIVSAGYRVGDESEPRLTFALGTQENSTKIAYTNFDHTGKKVTLTSATGYSVGDLVGAIENEGLSQIIAVGKISSIAGNILTVDRWDGSPGSMSLNPGGGDDFVYRMNGNTVPFGTLSPTVGRTALTGTSITSNAANGYTAYVSDDGNLRTPSSSIINVSDGTVTVGNEEYGWRVYGDKADNTGQDFAFSTSTQSIQTSTDVARIYERVGLVYKISVSSNTPAGNYSHIVRYTVTANY